jgi:phosphonate transport system permease protein
MVTQLDLDYLANTLNPLLDTLKMAYLGTLLGSLIALPIAFLASQNIVKNRYISITMKLILSLFRTLPSILYALIFAFVFGYGTFVGTISLAVFTLAISSKILYENIETLDMGAFQAIESTGATKLQAFTVSILPQIYGSFVSTALYSFEINIRYSAILGFVGAGGIGILLNDAMSLRDYGKVSVMLLGLLFLVLLTENLSRYVRKRVNA